MKKIFLDIETTGLNFNKDNIIEICCIEMENMLLNNNIFHSYIFSNKLISKEVYSVHNINNKFLLDKPKFIDIIENFLEFISNSNIIVHNAEFDIKFLNLNLKKYNYKNIEYYCKNIIDTLIISKKKFPNKSNSLNSLCKRFNIDIDRKFHSAYIDIILLYKVYMNLNENKNKLIFSNEKSIKNIELLKSDFILHSNNRDLAKHNKIFKKINECIF